MKKTEAKIWCVIFIGIIFIIPVSYLILKPHINSVNYENRELAAFPDSSVSFEKIPAAIDDFITDNFPYKNQIAQINGSVNKDVFRDNPSEKTILGKDGWLFFKGETGNSLAQYKGVAKFSEEELQIITDNICATRDYLEERGAKFILYIVPNKERVYSEYMPDSIKVADSVCNTDQLIEYIRNNTNIEMIWIYDELMDYKNNNPDTPIYYYYDTHWNNLGAYVGTKALCEKIGAKIQDVTFEQINNSSYDLANQAGLRLSLDGKDVDYSPTNLSNDYEIEVDDIDGSFIYHNTGKDERRLMIERDSFVIGMRQYIGNTFNESYMVHRNIFDKQMISDFNPDVFVYEICEREITKLLDLDIWQE